jgi:hypothetical protein
MATSELQKLNVSYAVRAEVLRVGQVYNLVS